jgi:hypothetical protein
MNRLEQLRAVKSALDEEDIEGLLATGCPADEYDHEASLIESEIAMVTDFGRKNLSITQCERIVVDVWIKQFGPFKAQDLEMRASAFTAVAKKLANAQ